MAIISVNGQRCHLLRSFQWLLVTLWQANYSFFPPFFPSLFSSFFPSFFPSFSTPLLSFWLSFIHCQNERIKRSRFPSTIPLWGTPAALNFLQCTLVDVVVAAHFHGDSFRDSFQRCSTTSLSATLKCLRRVWLTPQVLYRDSRGFIRIIGYST